ncbi:glycoside hydrolase family 3 C-terminal domain-containing protein [Paraburkholderia sp. BL10I2N1]|uniref:beta-glucosidase family protein n=1 Tax=Paraburkholderia sp. BL10I2N1 TaxID=1938796 RepID=UPI0010619C0E|nr:glycoside hydrolase family 3 C-terminal domain-containing protein [Paraburkholderia sp. BL10I2N1]TDN68271.1 beta-glucosidase [Paraburkholderia sp. BL10I2N1]
MKIERTKPTATAGKLKAIAILVQALCATVAYAAAPPSIDAPTVADQRADAVIRQMTQDELIQLVHGLYGRYAKSPLMPSGIIAGIPRLGIPDQVESDAGLGIRSLLDKTNGLPVRGADTGAATPLPSGLATASTWNPQRAFDGGAMIGEEAHRLGSNVLLGGGTDLARDPRNGRNFEYAGEDPLLAGTMVGAAIAGIQSRHVIATIKHYALNDQEANRFSVSSNIDWTAARESDLLAFELAIEKGDPGSVMCSYNKVNTVWACSSDMLLNQILKHDWHFKGYVMSDWGAVHDIKDALNGLDQESGESFDKDNGGPFFGDKLKQALADGTVPESRLKDMAHRILRTMYAKGVFDNPPSLRPIDVAADATIAQADEEEGIVLLKNAARQLPLAAGHTIAVIGSHADVGVLSGGGSSQVWPVGGPAVGQGGYSFPNPVIYDPSSPLKAIGAKAGSETKVSYDDGADPARAAELAKSADVAIVFAHQWSAETLDNANDLLLPDQQNELIAQVAAANPHTVVVLETGNPVLMPWLSKVSAVLEAWYPGAKGGEAIANVLYGDVNPSGRLPVTFPASVAQLPRPAIAPDAAVDYNIEGAAVGYRWHEQTSQKPLFPFGFGLSYSTFGYSKASMHGDSRGLTVSFNVTNTGKRDGKETAQVYMGLPAGAHAPERLAGFQKIDLKAGETKRVSVDIDPRLYASFDKDAGKWRVSAGTYPVYVGSSSGDLKLVQSVSLTDRRFGP